MRDRETIDSELRRLAAERRLAREHSGELSTHQLDKLLDERLGHRPEAFAAGAIEASATAAVADTWLPRDKAGDVTRYGRNRMRRRFGLLAALPLSLVAIAAAAVMLFAVHRPHPTAEPTVDPPSDGPANPAAQKPPAPPVKHAPQLGIVDKALIDALQHEGVPVPSNDYVTAHGHAVCDFLAQQPNFDEAARFVQRSSIWDANQSTDFTAGAVISYCPKYEPAQSAEAQQTYQKSLSALQSIQGDLQGINDDLQGIRDGLHPGN
ncbi:DUF732 domain-containing protein [Mycobacterium sp.]|uniref:DUF732 domain-containing protein n=1 Tax=Mycobacterium sp. TaxID=1785 RepID=UPI003F95E1DB